MSSRENQRMGKGSQFACPDRNDRNVLLKCLVWSWAKCSEICREGCDCLEQSSLHATQMTGHWKPWLSDSGYLSSSWSQGLTWLYANFTSTSNLNPEWSPVMGNNFCEARIGKRQNFCGPNAKFSKSPFIWMALCQSLETSSYLVSHLIPSTTLKGRSHTCVAWITKMRHGKHIRELPKVIQLPSDRDDIRT